jgi:hypothetical protein
MDDLNNNTSSKKTERERYWNSNNSVVLLSFFGHERRMCGLIDEAHELTISVDRRRKI